MEVTNLSDEQKSLGLFDFLIISLTFFVVGAMLAEMFFELSAETVRLLALFDNLICFFFFSEFLYRFYKASNKPAFMRWGWIDLLSSIPMMDVLRAGRVLRLIKLLRIIRAFRSMNSLIHHVYANRAKGALVSISVLAILMVIFSAIAILQLEDDPNSNIKTAEDAVWWTYTTITTVGYGDKYPVTTEGRILAMVLMTFGVGFFGTFTAYVSSIFVSDKK
jgi:voltage-gated potassium channel